jgi:hypothetical protein
VQKLPAASDAVHVVDWMENAAAFVPPRVAGKVNVSVCALAATPAAVAGNVSVAGVSDAAGTVALVPVPVSVMLTGEPDVLSVAVTVALNAPVVCGLNVNTSVQKAFGASPALAAGHVLEGLCVNAPVAPVMVMLLSVSVPVPLLVRFSVWAALVVPTLTLPKLTVEDGEIVSCGDPVVAEPA